MTDYKTGRIYKIIHNQSNIIYIGSTYNELRKRWSEHKKDFKKYLDNKKSEVSIYPYFKQYGIENFKIILIKEYQVVDKKHLYSKEQLWISKLKSINKNKTFNIKRLYQQNYHFHNKEKRGIYKKEYVKLNKEKIKEFQTNYSLNNKEKIKIKNNNYYKNNKDKILKQCKNYYELNKEKISDANKKKYICECGIESRVDSKARHERSKKHQNYLDSTKRNNKKS